MLFEGADKPQNNYRVDWYNQRKKGGLSCPDSSEKIRLHRALKNKNRIWAGIRNECGIRSGPLNMSRFPDRMTCVSYSDG